MHASRILSAACSLVALSAAERAMAEDTHPAQALFDRGVEHMEAGRNERACPLIEESYKLDPLPGTLFTLATCEDRRGRIAAAIARYDEYLALYSTLSPERKDIQGDRPDKVRAQKAALLLKSARLLLVLSKGAPVGTVVKLDGATVELSTLGVSAVLGASIFVQPGSHVVTAQGPGGPVTEVRVVASKGERGTVVLTVTPAALRPKVLPGTSMPDAGPSGRRVAAYIAGGIGAAGFVVGGIAGGLALDRKGVVEASCEGGVCNHAGKVAASRLELFGLASTIGFGVGVAGVGTGLVMLFTEPSEPSKKGASGRWVGVRAAPTYEGAALGIEGVW